MSEFRSRLITGNAELLLFETMLTLFREQGLVTAKGRQRTDSTHVLAAIHVLNRLECIGETLRHALNRVATLAPEWLQSWVPSEWFTRYSRRFEEYRLPPGKAERYALAEEVGADGRRLLLALGEPTAPSWLRDVPALQVLRQVWVQQFYTIDADGRVRWRTAEDLPPAPLLISSPYDPDARSGRKRETSWTGYKVHLSETCDDETPNLLTDVTTTVAPSSDSAVLQEIQDALAARHLTPSEHIVDSGYMSADHLLTSQTDHGIDLIGPVAGDLSWQAKAGEGFAAAQFVLDWEAHQATCPQGKTSVWWQAGQDRDDQAVVQIKFAKEDCGTCSLRAHCTRSASQSRRLVVRGREQFEMLQVARQRQQSEVFKEEYARRAGLEGTISQGVHSGGLRRSRYIGYAKTRLMHLLVGAALNFVRVAAWLAETPRSRTRLSAFAVLGQRMRVPAIC